MKKPIKRGALGDVLNTKQDSLHLDVFFITSVRAIKDNQLQVEVCQNRVLPGASLTALSVLNQADNRFGRAGTLLFDWLKVTPEDFVRAFPEVSITEDELNAIADTWDPENQAESGRDNLVYPIMSTVTKMVANGRDLSPIITVTEVTETQIKNGEFFTASSSRQKENIRLALEEERRVMKTPVVEGKEQDYIVDGLTGDRIFRYTRTEFQEFNPTDQLHSNKVSLAVYNSRKHTTSSATASPEEILEGNTELAS